MKVAVLASGSKGNASLLITNKVIMIDAGMNLKYIQKNLLELGINQIDAILLTHTHDDHILGLVALIKKYDPILVQKILCLVNNAEFKRRQSAPGVKISEHSFDLERRVPITHYFK